MRRSLLAVIFGLYILFHGPSIFGAETTKPSSHPALRSAGSAANRPLDKGPGYFVDALRGDDKSDGSQATPWQTIKHALQRLKAGDTLYLRGGIYYENVYVGLRGSADAKITIRSFPGEQAVLDGSFREFFAEPSKAWEPAPAGVAGEYRSTRAYPNIRNVMGSFGDSMIGLVTYYHAQDLRATGETFEPDPETKDVKPIYCGPGLWYDAATGRIHARLAATHIPGFENYEGETDPRRLPLVIAPFRSVPLHADGARHIRFQDLVIRGGGYSAVVLDQCQDSEFDNVVVWASTYGIRAMGVIRLRLFRSALYGSIPPWLGRRESSLKSRPGSPVRDIARYNTHALLVPEAGREFSVYAFPFNDDWDLSYCDFTDSSDALYFGGVNTRFHHNVVDRMQDDGLYLSPMYMRHDKLMGKAALHIYQNQFSRALTMIAFGGDELRNTDTIHFYRNIVDLRGDVNVGRPSGKQREGMPGGHVIGDHGSPPYPAMNIYQNTFVVRDAARAPDMWVANESTADRPRRVFNNIFVHSATLPKFALKETAYTHRDGNLYWQWGLDPKLAATYLTAYRGSSAFSSSKKVYAPGFEASSLVADPKFMKGEADPKSVNDYRISEGSAAIDAGVELPADWADPLRKDDKRKPDIGAMPLGAEPLKAGRAAAPKP